MAVSRTPDATSTPALGYRVRLHLAEPKTDDDTHAALFIARSSVWQGRENSTCDVGKNLDTHLTSSTHSEGAGTVDGDGYDDGDSDDQDKSNGDGGCKTKAVAKDTETLRHVDVFQGRRGSWRRR